MKPTKALGAWLLAPFLSVLLVSGCSPKAEPEVTVPPTEPNAVQSSSSVPSSGSGVQPIGSGMAGGLTPVTGAESVGGAGMAGVGQAAKDRARAAASGTGSAGQLDTSGD